MPAEGCAVVQLLDVVQPRGNAPAAVHVVCVKADRGSPDNPGIQLARVQDRLLVGVNHAGLAGALRVDEPAVFINRVVLLFLVAVAKRSFQRFQRRHVTAGTLAVCCRRGEGQAAGAPAEFSRVRLGHYADCIEVPYESPSALLEDFYARKNLYTRIRQRSADLRHIVQTILERDVHKYDLQCRQIRDTEKREKYKIYGELLNAYGYSVPAGAESCQVLNYYTGENIRIPLDPTLTPQQNAQKYFDRYARMKRTNEALTRLTAEVSAEIEHLRSIQNALEFSTTDGDLSQIRREMEESGFLRRKYTGRRDSRSDSRKGRSRTPQSKPLHYISSDGYDIFVGKNNTQNDEITFHMADSRDIWFHANDMPGSHVLLKSGGRSMDELPDRVFEEAAALAAYYSSGRQQGKVEIDYLERRNVKKPSGAAPGFVVYYTNYSILAKTDISALREVED